MTVPAKDVAASGTRRRQGARSSWKASRVRSPPPCAARRPRTWEVCPRASTAVGDSLSDVHRLDERIAEYEPACDPDGARGRAQPSADAVARHRLPHGERAGVNDRQRATSRTGVSSPLGWVWCPAAQLGRQDPAGQNHQGGRRLLANAPRARGEGGVSDREEQETPPRRLAVALDEALMRRRLDPR